MIITIDGPAVSGKSTVARAIAHQFGYYYLYSGSLFRALAYLLHTYAGYDAQNIAQVSQKDIDIFLDPTRFKYVYTQQSGERHARRTRRSRVYGGRNAASTPNPRRRYGPAVCYASQCLRPRPLPAYSARTLSETACGRRVRESVRDRAKLPE